MIIATNIDIVLLIVCIIFFILIIYTICKLPLNNLPINGCEIPDRINPSDYTSNYYLNIDNDIEKENYYFS
jgi:hypothetical protein